MTPRILHPRKDGRITLAWLRARKACKSQIILVQAMWGESHRMTRSTLRTAAEIGLDLRWLATELLTSRKARTVYREATEKADAEFDRRTQQSREACDKATSICEGYHEIFSEIHTKAWWGAEHKLYEAQAAALWKAFQVERKVR